jgi:hypothetical protein
MKVTSIAVATLVSLAGSAALAQSPNGFAATSSFGATAKPDAGQALFSSRGAVVTTGRIGNMQTTTLPGGGGGILMNNGNGTSTLIGPGTVTSVPTPR